jgi:hypothetical protein
VVVRSKYVCYGRARVYVRVHLRVHVRVYARARCR